MVRPFTRTLKEDKMTTTTLPRPYVNVMITYKGSVRADAYGGRKSAIVTRRAFYCDSDGYYNRSNEWVATPNGYFHVPQYWRPWTFSDGYTALMPHTFYHLGRVLPENVMEWKEDSN